MPIRVTTYAQAFDILSMKIDDKANTVLKNLEKDGHTERSISFAIWKSQTKLLTYKGESKFWGIFINEIRKWSWTRDDPRWKDYTDKKNEIKKADEIRKQFEKDRKIDSKSDKKTYQGYVYFIQGECGGAIKVGYAKDVSERLKGLQTGYPDKLKVITMIPGNVYLERKIHEELAGYRLNGEWFKPYEFVLNKIKEYQEEYGNRKVKQYGK